MVFTEQKEWVRCIYGNQIWPIWDRSETFSLCVEYINDPLILLMNIIIKSVHRSIVWLKMWGKQV